MRIGAVCDVSVLSSKENFKRSRELVSGDLYLPSATYSWVLRDKLVSVRGHDVGYSLLSQLVRDRRLLVVYLPELLEEISRKILFSVERGIPLTDLRTLMLAAHLGVPVATLDERFVDRLEDHLEVASLGSFEIGGGWSEYLKAVEDYRSLAKAVGDQAFECLNNGGRMSLPDFKPRKNNGHGVLRSEFLVLDLLPVVREYLQDRILPPSVLRGLCRQTLISIVQPNSG